MFTAIDNRKNYQYIVEQIQTMILNKELQCGDKLPPERELAEKLGVSRTSVREAMKSLGIMGILESRQGEGNFVVNKLDDFTTNSLSIMFSLNDGSPDDLIQLRRCIEIESIRNIIKRKSPKDIELLDSIILKYKNAENDVERLTYDKELHSAIVDLSGNILLKYLYKAMNDLFQKCMENAVDVAMESHPEGVAFLIREHDEIMESIRSGDFLRADRAITAHIVLSDADMQKAEKYRRWNLR